MFNSLAIPDAGNKTDLGAQRKVSTEDGKKLAGPCEKWNLYHPII